MAIFPSYCGSDSRPNRGAEKPNAMLYLRLGAVKLMYGITTC